MEKFISDINRCYHKIAEVPISQISSSVISLAYNYCNSFQEQELDKKPLLIGLPYKGNLGLILSAGLLKNFFNEDYLLHSGEHFKKLHLKNGDRIKIFGMHTSWFYSSTQRNGCIKLRQISDGPYHERVEVFNRINIKNEWLPYIEKIGGETKRIINLKTFYKRIQEHRVQRNALDKFLDYGEKGFGIPDQALFSKIILVSGRGRKGKTIQKLRDYKVFGDSLYNILIKTNGLEVLPDLKSFVDYFDLEARKKHEDFVNYAKKIFAFVPEYNTCKLLENLSHSDIHSESFITNLEDFESYLEDNEHLVAQNHLNELRRRFPTKQKTISENLKCIIIDNSSILNEYQNTVQGFLERNIPVIVLSSFSDDVINDSIVSEAYRFYFSKKKIKRLINAREGNVFDEEVLVKNADYLKQTLNIRIFNDANFENQIAKLTNFFFNVEGFEELKAAFWKIVYPVSILYKNSLQSDFTNYKLQLVPFFEVYDRVKNQLPPKAVELIDLLNCNDWTNDKKVEKQGLGFNQIITINKQSYDYTFKESLIKTEHLEDTYKSITFTGIPYKEYYQNNIVKAICKHCIPDINLLLFKKEFHTVKSRIEQDLLQHYFEDNIPFVGGIHPDYLVSRAHIENEISELFLFSTGDFKTDDVEIDLLNDELHQKFITAKRNQFVSSHNEEHTIDCVTLYFSNEEWMFVSKDSKHYIASEDDNDTITISKLPTFQIKKNDLMILYDLDVSQLTFLSSSNRPLQNSLQKLKIWRNIILDFLREKSFEDLRIELENTKTEEERKANPSIQNLRHWCNDEDLIAPLRENLSLILRFANKHEKLNEIDQARKDVITFRNSVRREIRNKLGSKLPKILLEKDPNSEFKIKIYGLNVKIKTREVSSLNQEVLPVLYQHTRKLILD